METLGFRIKVKILLALEGHSNKTRFINKLPSKQVESTQKKRKQFTNTQTNSRFWEKIYDENRLIQYEGIENLARK